MDRFQLFALSFVLYNDEELLLFLVQWRIYGKENNALYRHLWSLGGLVFLFPRGLLFNNSSQCFISSSCWIFIQFILIVKAVEVFPGSTLVSIIIESKFATRHLLK